MKLFVTGLITIGALFFWTTPYICMASFNFLLLLVGYQYRLQNKKIHAGLMSLGMLSDLALVLILEIQRGAIATAASFKLSALSQAHIVFSSVAVLLYFPVFVLGVFLLLGKASPLMRNNHIRLGKLTLLFRAAGFIFMFSMLQKSGAP